MKDANAADPQPCSHKFIPSTWFWDADIEPLPPMWLLCSRCDQKRLVVLTTIAPSEAKKLALLWGQEVKVLP